MTLTCTEEAIEKNRMQNFDHTKGHRSTSKRNGQDGTIESPYPGRQ